MSAECPKERREQLLEQIVLDAKQVAELLNCCPRIAYEWIAVIRSYMVEAKKQLPCGKRVTVTAFKEYLDIK